MSEFIDYHEGWDSRATVYDEKAEKKYESTIWKALLAVFTVALIATVVLTIDNVKLYFTGNSVTGVYDEAHSSVIVEDENGTERFIYLAGGVKNKLKDGKATLYYTGDNMLKAQELLEPKFYLMAYGFFVPGEVLCIYMLYRIYKKRK